MEWNQCIKKLLPAYLLGFIVWWITNWLVGVYFNLTVVFREIHSKVSITVYCNIIQYNLMCGTIPFGALTKK